MDNITGLLYASVDRNGVVTGWRPGVAQVICRVGGLEATCRVTVEAWPEGLEFAVSRGMDDGQSFYILTIMAPLMLTRDLLQLAQMGYFPDFAAAFYGLTEILGGLSKLIADGINWIKGLFTKEKTLEDYVKSRGGISDPSGAKVHMKVKGNTITITASFSYTGPLRTMSLEGKTYSVSIRSNIVDPETNNFLLFTYMHMAEPPLVRAEARVSIGTPLGKVGTTGNSSGNHLHFECSNHSGNLWAPSNSSDTKEQRKRRRARYRINPVYFYTSGTWVGDASIWDEVFIILE